MRSPTCLLALTAALALASATAGCAQGGFGPPPDPDAGPEDPSQARDASPDLPDPGRADLGPAGPDADMGPGPEEMGLEEMGPDEDMTEEMGPPAPTPLRTTWGPSGGGGPVRTPAHRARVLIGAPSPVGEVRAGRYRIRLGPGPAQHGQRDLQD